jgi:hypothetical protein
MSASTVILFGAPGWNRKSWARFLIGVGDHYFQQIFVALRKYEPHMMLLMEAVMYSAAPAAAVIAVSLFAIAAPPRFEHVRPSGDGTASAILPAVPICRLNSAWPLRSWAWVCEV